ncbi:hypothetical protein DHX103_06520 [Planococcus sp. X10-3]|uniref:hypothetical protein n=1 Tax=Planococcus sp. X10-3 TaxID=3061240 RepID=UPI003BB0699A
MWRTKKRSAKELIAFMLVCLLIIGGSIYYVLFYSPKNSLELYQDIAFADDFDEMKKLMLEGYEGNFTEEDFNYINSLGNAPTSVGQFTLFEYNDRSFVILTSPGTDRLKVLNVEEAPEEIREYFLELRR